MNAPDDAASVEMIVEKARTAQGRYARDGSQARYDRAALAAAWAIMEPGRNEALSRLAVEATGLGNVPDKITKNHRKTLGLMRDLSRARTCGVVENDPETGITRIARPMGVVAAVVPSTNPAATPANNVINALKCGNAIVLSPSPKGVPCSARLIEHIHAEFEKIGEDPDLVQMLPPPGSKAKTQRLLELADLTVVTGSQNNVRRAYTAGTPTIGVGAGNVAVIVDETAVLEEAAGKIAASKCFDNATSCSSENAVIVVDAVYDDFKRALEAAGGAVLPASEEGRVVEGLWPDGAHLSPALIARDPDVLIDGLGLAGKVPDETRFLAVETDGIGPEHRLSGEKLSLVMALYRARDFDHAAELAGRSLVHQGAGHSCGIHTCDDERPTALGRTLPACRIIVNQAHTFAAGGSFENGMPFSLSMGCGSWGGNSIDDNLHWRHFLQHTKVVRTIPADEPSIEEIFADYWREAGQ